MADDHPDVLPADLGLVLRGGQCRRADPDRRCASEWAPPKFDSVNPLQDATTDLLETRAGFSTIAQQIAKRGQSGSFARELANGTCRVSMLGQLLQKNFGPGLRTCDSIIH